MPFTPRSIGGGDTKLIIAQNRASSATRYHSSEPWLAATTFPSESIPMAAGR